MSADAQQRKTILGLLRSSDVPLTVKQVANAVSGSASSKNVAAVRTVLEELKDSGDAFEFPPERIGGEPKFGGISPVEWLAAKIVGKVGDAGGRVTVRQARESLPKWGRGYFDQCIGKLVKDGRLFYLTVRFKYVLLSQPTPFDHLLPRQVTALKEILERVNRFRKSRLPLEELQAFLNGSDQMKVPTADESGRPSEDLLRTWYQMDLPRRGGISSIPIWWTWGHYESWCLSNNLRPDLIQFHDLMRNLHRTGKIDLIPHSMTQEIPAREVELSLRSEHGEVLYYWKWV